VSMDRVEARTARGEEQTKVSVRKTLVRLWRYLSRSRGKVVMAVILTILSNLMALFCPLLSGRAIGAIEPGPGAVDFGRVFYYCAWMGFFYIISSVLNYLLSVQMISLSQNVSRRMREDVFAKLLDLPVSFFDNHSTGEIINHISYDIDTVNASISADLLQICTSVVTVLGSMIMMFFLSPLLSLVFLITIPLGGSFIRYKAKQIHASFRNRSVKLGDLNGFVEEIVTGHKTIKAYHQEGSILGRFDEYNDDAVNAYYVADYNGAILGTFVNFINNLSMSFAGAFGAVLYLIGHLTLGNMSSFVLYSRKFSGPINEAANIFSEIQSAAAAADRVFNLIDQEPEPPDLPCASDLGPVEGNIRMSHIRFGYEPDAPVLKDLSLVAEKGSMTAIVGPTGAGKTTVINLLMRFYDAESGVLTIDGRNVTDVTRHSLRRAFAMVLQESWLFHGTVFENVAYGLEGATMDDVVSAAEAAQAHGFVMQLPDGYDTVLDEDGINISKGQKQLLTIARAMLLDVEMLILDEATSNVDTRTEIKIQEAMRKLMRGKTCFVIAHRLSTIQNADNILVMRDGDVVENGVHDELLIKKGVYYSLYHSQFG